jgi:hypothetical protein
MSSGRPAKVHPDARKIVYAMFARADAVYADPNAEPNTESDRTSHGVARTLKKLAASRRT